MTKEDKIKKIEGVIKHYNTLDKNMEDMSRLLGRMDLEGGLWKDLYELFDDYAQSVSHEIGDEWESIHWYIFENHCGQRGMVYNGISCKNVENLVDSLEKNV